MLLYINQNCSIQKVLISQYLSDIKMGRTRDQDNDSVAADLQSAHDSDSPSEEIKKKYKCNYPDCRSTFLRPSRLERHMRTHSGERPYKCSHPGCTKSYTNSSHLKRHMETHSSIKKIYKCPECSLSMSYLHNLKHHYNRMHNEEKKMVCKECDKTFNKKHQFVHHQALHSGSTPYKCDKCDKCYSSRSRLKEHKKIHEKSYPCPVPGCSEKFEKWLLLCAHRKAKHVTNYKCDTCDKVFFSKYKIRMHCKIHFENRLVLPCPYDNCHRFYFSRFNLEKHVSINHLGEKFYCDICSVGLSSKQRLKEHTQHHHEPKKRKKRKVQQKRKDAGVPKRSVLTALIGVKLPHHLEKIVMERETKINDTIGSVVINTQTIQTPVDYS